MACIVVGGHSRNIGKTQLAVEIIRAFPAARWVAAKITQYRHGVCPINGENCHCAVDEHTFAVQVERDRSGRSDTSRFLAAGAERALWVRSKQGRLAEAMPLFRRHTAGAENLIIESNTVLHFLHPDLYLPLLEFSVADFKDSSREFLDRADAYVLLAPRAPRPAWDAAWLRQLERRPVFVVWPEKLCSAALAAFIRERVFPSPGETIT
jgi:hypothetical protein